jgi:hypothetical protein
MQWADGVERVPVRLRETSARMGLAAGSQFHASAVELAALADEGIAYDTILPHVCGRTDGVPVELCGYCGAVRRFDELAEARA